MEDKMFKFLFKYYFKISTEESKDFNTALGKCVDRAYQDFNRTLRFKSKNEDDRKKFKENTKEKLCEIVKELKDAEYFDAKHKDCCEQLLKCANDTQKLAKPFTYGQAQKWINMTFKYLWLMGYCEEIEKELHVPIDNIIIDKAKENGVNPPSSESWSNWNDYTIYENYQKKLQEFADKIAVTKIQWEYDNWIN